MHSSSNNKPIFLLLFHSRWIIEQAPVALVMCSNNDKNNIMIRTNYNNNVWLRYGGPFLSPASNLCLLQVEVNRCDIFLANVNTAFNSLRLSPGTRAVHL